MNLRPERRLPNLPALLLTAVLAGSLVTPATPGMAQDIATGAQEFAAWCARCHGGSGKGDGPMAAELEKPLPDLAQLSKRNDGAFPAEQVRETIDGRDVYLPHRSSEMPTWGNWFEFDITAGGLLEKSETKTQEEIDQRIDRIVAFIASLQE